jgi:hypothetical protein
MPTKSSDELVLMGAYKAALNNQKIKDDLLYYVNRTSFDTCPQTASFKEGERALALRILRYAEIIE